MQFFYWLAFLALLLTILNTLLLPYGHERNNHRIAQFQHFILIATHNDYDNQQGIVKDNLQHSLATIYMLELEVKRLRTQTRELRKATPREAYVSSDEESDNDPSTASVYTGNWGEIKIKRDTYLGFQCVVIRSMKQLIWLNNPKLYLNYSPHRGMSIASNWSHPRSRYLFKTPNQNSS